MEKKEIYAIYYNNGESWDDHWSGILVHEGCYSDALKAEERIKQLQIEHDERIKADVEDGYVYPPDERESWKVKSITYHYEDVKSIPIVNPNLLNESNES